jgi:DNA polymerase eta
MHFAEDDEEHDTPARDTDEEYAEVGPDDAEGNEEPDFDVPPLAQQPPFTLLAASSSHQTTLETYLCNRCSKKVPIDNKIEHEDFHFAQDLQNERSSPPPAQPPPKPVPPAKSAKPKARARPPGGVSGNGGVEKGQRRLAFG